MNKIQAAVDRYLYYRDGENDAHLLDRIFHAELYERVSQSPFLVERDVDGMKYISVGGDE